MKTESPLPPTSCVADVCVCSPHSPLQDLLTPSLGISSTPTSVASTAIYLLMTPGLSVSPSQMIYSLHRGIRGEGPQVHQKLCAWNRPDPSPPPTTTRPVPPSSLSLWMAPSFSRLHIWKPGCLPQLLPPVYCLVQSPLPSQSPFSTHD